YWNGPGAWQAMPQPSRDAFLRVGRKVYLEVRAILADRTPAQAYTTITAPSLLLEGERSPAAAHRVIARLAEALPNVSVKRIESAGHMGPITHADVVNDAIATTIRSAVRT